MISVIGRTTLYTYLYWKVIILVLIIPIAFYHWWSEKFIKQYSITTITIRIKRLVTKLTDNTIRIPLEWFGVRFDVIFRIKAYHFIFICKMKEDKSYLKL